MTLTEQAAEIVFHYLYAKQTLYKNRNFMVIIIYFHSEYLPAKINSLSPVATRIVFYYPLFESVS